MSDQLANEQALGIRLRTLRKQAKLSIRQLSKLAGVSASYVTGVESGRISPTISTFRKLLTALGTDLGGFFAEDTALGVEDHIFRAEAMHLLNDAHRRYTFVLPRRTNIHVEVVDERILPADAPEYEVLASDLAGYVLEGDMVLDIKDQPPQRLHPFDAFYIPAGTPVRGFCAHSDTPVHLITIYTPPRY
jgi:transcriptional regulator with XRE-family HTH domain